MAPVFVNPGSGGSRQSVIRAVYYVYALRPFKLVTSITVRPPVATYEVFAPPHMTVVFPRLMRP